MPSAPIREEHTASRMDPPPEALSMEDVARLLAENAASRIMQSLEAQAARTRTPAVYELLGESVACFYARLRFPHDRYIYTRGVRIPSGAAGAVWTREEALATVARLKRTWAMAGGEEI